MAKSVLVIENEQKYIDQIQTSAPAGWVVFPILVFDIEQQMASIFQELEKLDPDFCIVEPNLGRVMDGLTAIRLIRQNKRRRPVVILSQYISDPEIGPLILKHYEALEHTQLLNKNPFPSWDEIARAAALAQQKGN